MCGRPEWEELASCAGISWDHFTALPPVGKQGLELVCKFIQVFVLAHEEACKVCRSSKFVFRKISMLVLHLLSLAFVGHTFILMQLLEHPSFSCICEETSSYFCFFVHTTLISCLCKNTTSIAYICHVTPSFSCIFGGYVFFSCIWLDAHS